MLPEEVEYMAIELHNYRTELGGVGYTDLSQRDQDFLKVEAGYFIQALNEYRKPAAALTPAPSGTG